MKATVLLLSTVDIDATDHEEDTKDMHAKREDYEKIHANAETKEEPSMSSDTAVPAR
jgi:hypothetical protein